MKQKCIYQKVTKNILEALREVEPGGLLPWHNIGMIHSPQNISSKSTYRGINLLSLWFAAQSKTFTFGYWGTLKQWNQVGRKVKKGERGVPGIFWSVVQDDEHENQDSESAEKKRIITRQFSLFNYQQTEGEPFSIPDKRLNLERRIEECEKFLSSLPISVRFVSKGEAYYSKQKDEITMPPYECFKSRISYYSVLAHELIHATGHFSRLARFEGAEHTPAKYAEEEFVAELGAAFVLARLGLGSRPRDHARYIKSWVKGMEDNPSFLIRTASKAQKAADWLFENTISGEGTDHMCSKVANTADAYEAVCKLQESTPL